MSERDEGFRKELACLINRYSRENGSDTPDFILADYLDGCLRVFDGVLQRRETWYGRKRVRAIAPRDSGKGDAAFAEADALLAKDRK